MSDPAEPPPGAGRAKIRLLVADDQALVRGGFVALLDAQDDIEVIGEAENGEQAVRMTRALVPDVVLMDIRMPIRDALLSPGVTRRLLAEFSTHAKQPPPAAFAELTDREREVMILVAEGLTNAEIGARLYMSPATARTHVSRILTKLAARDRTQLVVLAYESGLVRPGWQ
ncbi:response regulator transcription factor [Nocardia salmonicida]